MPKPIKFSYKKKVPFRDAFFLIIICEGQNREPQYFRFFDGLSSRVKVIPIESNTGSSPKWLIEKARAVEVELDIDPDKDRIWFVIDTDRWRNQLLEIRQECALFHHWNVAQSNPCFEVWLYFHAKSTLPELTDITQCNHWKPHLPKVIKGGFNSDFHPAAIETAIGNARKVFKCTGYYPDAGCTEVWKLAEELLSFVKLDLAKFKCKFPEIEVLV
jgi:hypothetical protein